MRQILHVSDVHFGPRHVAAAAEAVHALAAERRPDLVVVSGDLTQRARRRQFRAARAWVARFAAPVLAVPGNHDVPLYRVWERVLAPFGAYRRHFAADCEPEWSDREMLVVGVNTAHGLTTLKNGRVTAAQRRRLIRRLAGAPCGAARVVVAHHQLVPAPGAAERTVLRHARQALAALHAAAVDVVLSGHLHQAFVAAAPGSPPGAVAPLLVHSGTSTSSRGRGPEHGRMTANWIVIDEEAIAVRRLEFDAGASRFAERDGERYRRRPAASRGG